MKKYLILDHLIIKIKRFTIFNACSIVILHILVYNFDKVHQMFTLFCLDLETMNMQLIFNCVFV
jgi:hypothetical protein